MSIEKVKSAHFGGLILIFTFVLNCAAYAESGSICSVIVSNYSDCSESSVRVALSIDSKRTEVKWYDVTESNLERISDEIDTYVGRGDCSRVIIPIHMFPPSEGLFVSGSNKALNYDSNRLAESSSEDPCIAMSTVLLLEKYDLVYHVGRLARPGFCRIPMNQLNKNGNVRNGNLSAQCRAKHNDEEFAKISGRNSLWPWLTR